MSVTNLDSLELDGTLEVAGAITATGGVVAPQTVPAAYIQSKEVTFTEVGAGTYTGTIAVPAGATIIDIIVHATALWDAATSASLQVGDAVDPDGWYTAVDLKAVDLLAAESLSFSKAGGVEGAFIAATHVIGRYHVAAYNVIGEVVSVGAGTLGRTRMTVVYSLPISVVAATFVA